MDNILNGHEMPQTTLSQTILRQMIDAQIDAHELTQQMIKYGDDAVNYNHYVYKQQRAHELYRLVENNFKI